MSLKDVQLRNKPVPLPGGPPYAATALRPLAGKRFFLPADDPWVRQTGTTGHAYLDGARGGWADHPEYMDFLDPDSPVFGLKSVERDLCLHHWAPWFEGETALDVGAGIGRFTQVLLDRGATVHAVDADLESLRRLVWHAAGKPGRLDVHWSTALVLPEVTVDLALAAEVLCYVPDTLGALRALAARVRPGGVVLLSMEARWGWAASQDAPANGIRAALDGDGVVDLPGDRWVRTLDREGVERLVADAGLTLEALIPSHWIPDGPLEDAAPAALDLPTLLALEERCRAHPVWGPLNRLWLVAARVPSGG